jgi:hypothetical protein
MVCANLLIGKITKNTKVKIDWVGYEFKIRSKYGVEVVGKVPIPRMQPAAWPLETVLAVCDRLVNGTIDFVPMTKDHIAALAAKHKAVCAASGTVSGRAGCKDKGRTYVPLLQSCMAGMWKSIHTLVSALPYVYFSYLIVCTVNTHPLGQHINILCLTLIRARQCGLVPKFRVPYIPILRLLNHAVCTLVCQSP